MKILFITSKSFGGSGRYIEVLAKGLKEKGYECDLLYFALGVDQDIDIEKPFRDIYHFPFEPSMSPIGMIKNIRFAISVIKNKKYSWVHSHTSLGGLLGRVANFLSNKNYKMAHTLHAFGADEFTPIPQKWIYWIIERILDLGTDVYFCPSNYMKLYGKRTFVINYKKCRVVYNSLPLKEPPNNLREISEQFKKSNNIKEDEVLFLFCGRIERQKGVDVLIKAFARVNTEINARLIICGEGEDMTSMMELADSKNVSSNIIWAGWQTNLDSYYSAADVYIMPSRWESFGLVFLEAMNYSLPILSCSVQAIPEVVSDGEVGLLSPSEDDLSLSENIKLMGSNKKLRLKMGTKGKMRQTNNFSYQAFVDGHDFEYKKTIF